MNNKLNAITPHISLFGNRNTGKSSLLNAIIGQDVSLVSEIKGTTTDPVKKKMELLPLGPVLFIDTAGIDDEGILGEMRVERSKKILQQTDFALVVIDINKFDRESLVEIKRNLKKFNTPFQLVFNKIDLANAELLINLKTEFEDAVFVSTLTNEGIENLKNVIIYKLNGEKEPPIVGDLLNYGDTVVLVVPIDSEAPKGRIILPQVQIIRDCLDHGIHCHVVRDTELEAAIQYLPKIDLVITDSQAFKMVSKLVPNNVLLTGFSTLFARYKGDLENLLKGVDMVKKLTSKSKILIAESCSHNVSHNDIGHFKIPKLLEKNLNLKLNFEHKMGSDFPEMLDKYDLIIHCGSCMLNRKTMKSRMQLANENNIPMVNYGILLAHLNGVLDRSIEIFKRNNVI